MQAAEDLDHVIAAHERFLDHVMARALLDDASKVPNNKFDNIPRACLLNRLPVSAMVIKQ